MTSPKMSYNPVILPTNVVPMHYDLTLEPQFPTSRFTGTVKIDLNIVEESTSITLHTLEIEIASASIWVAIEGSEMSSILCFLVNLIILPRLAPISRISSNSTTQTTTFDFDKPLAKGASPTLIIEYKGLLNENRAGFYKVVYQKSDGTQGNIAVSCMESIYARRVFPCFDEPLLKAKFTITLKAPSSFTCLSNMDVDHKCPGEGNTVTFQKSPPMSTYLVAFVIGDFQYIEHNDGTPRVRVYTPSAHATTKAGSNKSLLSALELLSKTIRFFEDKLGIPFLLSKLVCSYLLIIICAPLTVITRILLQFQHY
jgi:aminopeptidase 2